MSKKSHIRLAIHTMTVVYNVIISIYVTLRTKWISDQYFV